MGQFLGGKKLEIYREEIILSQEIKSEKEGCKKEKQEKLLFSHFGQGYRALVVSLALTSLITVTLICPAYWASFSSFWAMS